MSPVQQRVLDVVRDGIEISGVSPTIREIAQELEVRSTGHVHEAVIELIRQGKLARTKAHVRNLVLPDRVDLTPVATSALQAELKRRGAPEAPTRHVSICDTAPCAYDACGERVERGNWFCHEHWFALPKGLRNELLAARNHSGFDAVWTRAILSLEARDRA
jgi:hypothetical protein